MVRPNVIVRSRAMVCRYGRKDGENVLINPLGLRNAAVPFPMLYL